MPGEAQYRNHGVAYCPHCDGPLFKGKPVAVVGDGNSGVEAAIDLAGIVQHVTLLEFADALRYTDRASGAAHELALGAFEYMMRRPAAVPAQAAVA